MGTRTAPRQKTKRIQRKKQQRSRLLAQGKIEKETQSATLGKGNIPPNLSEGPADLAQENSPKTSPAETAKTWAEQNEANSTIKQVAAAALILGQKVSKTASALGVDRRTIQRWQKLDPEFQLAMVETRQEVVLSSRQYLLALAEEAADVVGTKLNEEQNTQVALSLLRGIGVLAPQSVEAKMREEVQAAKDFCAQSATLGESESEDRCHAPRSRGHVSTNTANEFRAQTATSGQPKRDDSRTNNDFCAQTATLAESENGCHAPRSRGHAGSNTENEFRAQTATLGETNETALPTDEEEFPPSLQGLPPSQQLAIEALYEGKTLAEVAPIAGTSEATIRSWLCGDKRFFEVLSGLQFDRIYHLKYRLLTLVNQAMQIIQTALSQGNGRVAMAILRGFGTMREA